MSESQPQQGVLGATETQEVIKGPETEIPYALAMEKREIMDLFRGDNPGNPETKRLVTLWMEEARSVEAGLLNDSPLRDSLLKAAQENIFTVASLARWDTTVDPEALLRYDAWLVKAEAWVSEVDGVARARRQFMLEIVRSDVYLSVGDEEEAYACLDLVVEHGVENDDLIQIAKGKIDAITKVLNFLNENAKKPE